jgi:site-specific DNA recombinase
VAINDWLEEDENRSVHFVKQNLVIHKNAKSDEKFRWDIEIVLAKKYIANLSEEVKKGQKEKLAQGEFPKKPPLGYKSVGERRNTKHVIDQEKAPLMRKMFELYATGNYSLNALLETMHKEGLRSRDGNKVGKSRIHKYLSNPFYYGKMCWNGVLYQGKHEAIISKELFDVVQKRLTRKTENPQYKTHLPVFKAKIKCDECGGTITWELQKGHWYGHCNHYKKCSQTEWMKQYEVEDQLFPLFEKVAPKSEKVLKWLVKAMKESHINEIDYNEKQRESLNRIIRTTDQRIEQAYRDKLDSKMPMALCEKIMQESTKEKEDAIESLEKLSKSRTAYYEAGYAIHELALKASAIYQSPKTKTEDKRLLLSYIFSNLSLNADKISPNYTFAFEFMLEFMPNLNSTFELADFGSNKTKKGISASSCPSLCALRDSNPRPSGSKPDTLSS